MVLMKDNIKIFIMAIKTILQETRRKNQGMKYSDWRVVLMSRFCVARIKLDFFLPHYSLVGYELIRPSLFSPSP